MSYETEMKIEYRTKEGIQSYAYIDEKTREGIDKYTDKEIKVVWRETVGWAEIDR